MATQAQTKLERAEEILASNDPTHIEQAEIARGSSQHQPPTSVRLSAPLLEAIDRLAADAHRKRGNMIQHILWEYVHQHGGESQGSDINV